MILPPPFWAITRATACATRKAPVRFTCRMRCHSSRVVSRKGRVAADAGVVGEYVDPPERGHDGLYHSVDGRRIADVRLDPHRAPSGGLDGRRGFDRARLVEIGNRDRRSLAGEDLGGREPDATAASSDKSVFSRKAHAPLLSRACRTTVAKRDENALFPDLPALEGHFEPIDGGRAGEPQHMGACRIIARDDGETLRCHSAQRVARGVAASDHHTSEAVALDQPHDDFAQRFADAAGDLPGVERPAGGNTRRAAVSSSSGPSAV